MRILLSILLLSSMCSLATATEIPQSAPQTTAQTTAQLLTIQRDISWLQQSIEQRKKQLAHAGKDDSAEISDAVSDLELRLQRARLSFIALASEVELPTPENDSKPKKRDLVQEAQQLIEPLFDAVHRVSEKPRRIEALRSRIFSLNDQLTQTDKAIANLDRVILAKTFPVLEKELKESRESLSHDRDESQVRLDSFQRKLEHELSDHRTVVQVLTESIQDFFASKGRNLLIAILVFTGVFWTLLFLKSFIFRSRIVHSKLHGLSRPLQMVYGILAALIAILAVIFTLHFLNDWFLVTVLLLILLAAGWSSKALITHFISETKLALNLGPVKQGERVIWQGVPWLVKSLGFRSVLVNEALQGGLMMLPASALTTMLSRTTVENEPWFPTLAGDFVQLDDGNYGRVETQTPEMVVLNCGGARKFYSTSAFLLKNPHNFSHGFEVSVDLVLRHSTPTRPLGEIRPALLKAVSSKLGSRLSKFEMTICASGHNVTRIWIKADCPGSLAKDRDALKRELHSAAGEAWRETVEL